jgi:hypothetical protein
VILRGRSVGFTGWIGGAAIFNRALGAKELAKSADLRSVAPGRRWRAGRVSIEGRGSGRQPAHFGPVSSGAIFGGSWRAGLISAA